MAKEYSGVFLVIAAVVAVREGPTAVVRRKKERLQGGGTNPRLGFARGNTAPVGSLP